MGVPSRRYLILVDVNVRIVGVVNIKPERSGAAMEHPPRTDEAEKHATVCLWWLFS